MVLINVRKSINSSALRRFVCRQRRMYQSFLLVFMVVGIPSVPVSAQRASFDPSRYNPAVLHIRFTPAKGRTTSARSDAFLDMTLISAGGVVEGVRAELSSAEFRRQLSTLYQQLSRLESLDTDDPSSPSRQLHELFFGELGYAIEREKVSTLLISADRGLQALPFAALSDGKRFFGERFAFSITPSLALMDFDLQPLQQDKNRLLALGASRFKGLVDLPLVPQETKRIGDPLKKDLFLDQDFTLSTLINKGADPRYDRLHIATHAEFTPGGPSSSRLYSGVGPVSMQELASLRKMRRGIPLDLVVFSACRTALGDADAELGFSGLALQAGARSAVGTLWYVDDVSTSAYFVLMYSFLQKGVPKANAMQLTRQAFLRGDVRLVGDQVQGPDGQPLLTELTSAQQRRVSNGLENPFYWAGITLMGSP